LDAALDWRLLLVAGVGALLSLDRRASVQAMLSHPVVASALVGWLLGDLATGLGVGVLLGLLWSGALPVGGVVPPDETLGAVAGTAVAILGARAAGADVMAASAAGFIAGVPAALAGRRLELALRRYNGELGRRVEKQVRDGDLRSVERATLLALGAAFAGAFVTYLLLIAAGVPLARHVVLHWPGATPLLAVASFPVPFAGLGAVIAGAGFRMGLAWATLGFAIGILLAEVAGR
jgi:mannose/fructose/N-acetylgalactosamine-specific phosphotransferase system component IIC